MLCNEAMLTETIASIYDAAIDRGGWELALQGCSRLLGGVAAQIYAIDSASRECIYQIDHGLPQQYKDEYAAHFSRESERNILHQQRPDIDLSYDYMFFDERQIDRHDGYRFRRDFGFRYYLGTVLFRDHDALTLAAVQRSPAQGHASDSDIATFRLLRSHLARAVQVGNRLAELDMRQRGAWEAIENSLVGVIALGRQGQVRRCNRAARKILNARDGLLSEAGKLKARRPIDDRALQDLIGSALRNLPAGVAGNMPIARSDADLPYSVIVTPIPALGEFEALVGDHVLVLLNDPERLPGEPVDLLRRHYGLSHKQTELALLLSSGRTVAECADNLGIAEKTARRHLAIIFARTGLHRQVDLVRLVLSLPQQPQA